MVEPKDDCAVLTRQELYEKVWTTAMRILAPQLGVSDVGLSKICKRFSIPTPPVGYWAKKEFGKAPDRPPLPDYDGPELNGINFHPNARESDPAEHPEGNELIEREKAKENQIIVAEALVSPHPLIEPTQRSLLAAKPGENGVVAPGAKRTLDIQVAPERIDRALRIMDALLKALDQRSLPLSLRDEEGHRATVVTVQDEKISISLGEVVNKEVRPPTPEELRDPWSTNKTYYRHVPTGRLSLHIGASMSSGRRSRWSDTDRRPLEHLLNSFVASLYRAAEDRKAERRRLEQLQRQRVEAERERREWEQLRAQKVQEIREEEKRVTALLAEVDKWRRSQEVTAYLKAVREALIAKNGQIAEGSDVQKWLAWAEQQADRLDPLVKSPPSILDEKEKWEKPSYSYNW